ncbi:MAG: carbohydrate kinase [Acidobacteria bacterium]|nr:MAG: carbohydrate kinase [Acidobacteriota bacterium]
MKSYDAVANTSDSKIVAGLGELIWDMLPGGKQLGGAPTNFAYISRLLGNNATVASRVGDDDLGREASARLARMGISEGFLQVDRVHPTGTVQVKIGEDGEARFAINENSAWDYLEWTARWEELASNVDAVCFGTLGQRNEQAREVVLRFLRATRSNALRIFDVNLRHSFFTPDMLTRSVELATIVKLNSEELSMVAGMLDIELSGEEDLAKSLIARFNLDLIAVTRGKEGSLLVTANETFDHPGFRVQVKDTIGAGDAFAATLTHYYLRGAPLKVISEEANRVGAWIATQTGATPEVDRLPVELGQFPI